MVQYSAFKSVMWKCEASSAHTQRMDCTMKLKNTSRKTVEIKKKNIFNEEDDLHFTMKVILFFALHANQPHIIVLRRLFVNALIHVWRGSLSACV